MNRISSKTLGAWKQEFPILKEVTSMKEVFWTNPKYETYEKAIGDIPLTENDIKDAEERLQRFAPYIAAVFPETRELDGIIESPIVEISNMLQEMEQLYNYEAKGKLLLKCDSHLAVSGSIKARGGIYEVLKHAEDLAIAKGMLTKDDNYSIMDSLNFRDFFSEYTIVVGSTGNLGLSIGIMSAKMGFNVTVHMSADAKQWKKDLLREKGANVVEHNADYSKAVEEGRKEAESNIKGYFVDDENSRNLFLGYAVAASRLKKQLHDLDVTIDADHQLYVYLPCGVGGAPGGIAFGLKTIFKDHVHCFFAEPTHSPSMLLGLVTGEHHNVSVHDFGLDNATEADGLAVGRPSEFVGKTVEHLLSGSYTVDDDRLFVLLSSLIDTEDLRLEPSALAGLYGPIQLFKETAGKKYVDDHQLKDKMINGIHLVWGTGGSMVPEKEMESYYLRGTDLKSRK